MTKASRLDEKWCTGSVTCPEPKPEKDDEAFRFVSTTGTRTSTSLLVRDWIQGLQDDPPQDKLAEADQIIDGSIGGLGRQLEQVYDGTREVPIFEFRAPTEWQLARYPENWRKFVEDFEEDVINYHLSFGTPAPDPAADARRIRRSRRAEL